MNCVDETSLCELPTWVPPAGYVHVDPKPNAAWRVAPPVPCEDLETLRPPRGDA